MNEGIYLEDLIETSPTNFCIGVGGYPEKHFEAPNLKKDIEFLKNKIDSGADYIVTQMFFNNEDFFNFKSESELIRSSKSFLIFPSNFPSTYLNILLSIFIFILLLKL